MHRAIRHCVANMCRRAGVNSEEEVVIPELHEKAHDATVKEARMDVVVVQSNPIHSGTGQDRTGQDRTGQDRTVQRSSQFTVHSSQFTVHSCTVAQLHSCTVAQLHSCTVAQLHSCTVAQLHSCTVAQLHSCTVAQLHSCTVAQLHSCTVAQWHSGTVAQWHSGTVAQWHSGTVAQWHSGTVAQWHSGTVAQWHSGTVAQWHSGTVAQWHSGTVAQWHCGHCGTVALWHCGTVALWHCGAVAQWRSGAVAQLHSCTVQYNAPEGWRRTSAPEDGTCLCGKPYFRRTTGYLHEAGVFACRKACTYLTEPQTLPLRRNTDCLDDSQMSMQVEDSQVTAPGGQGRAGHAVKYRTVESVRADTVPARVTTCACGLLTFCRSGVCPSFLRRPPPPRGHCRRFFLHTLFS